MKWLLVVTVITHVHAGDVMAPATSVWDEAGQCDRAGRAAVLAITAAWDANQPTKRSTKYDFLTDFTDMKAISFTCNGVE